MTISSVTATSASRAPQSGAEAIQPVQPVAPVAPLAPAVRVDIRRGDTGRDRESPPAQAAGAVEPAENQQRMRIDAETKTVVYQVVDPSSGDVVVQLPDATILKARAYADAVAVRNRPVERPLDRTA